MILPLCAQVPILPDECLSSLLVRTATANVVHEVADLTKHIGIASRNTDYLALRQSERAEDVAQLLGQNPLAIAAMFHPRVRGREVDTINWFDTPLERRFLEVADRRFSPRGIVRSAHGHSLWMIRPLYFCPENLDVLVDSCVACGAKLGWRRGVALDRCHVCEQALGIPSGALPDWRHADAATLGKLLSSKSEVRRAVLTSLPPPFCSWEAGDVFTAIVELGAAAVNSDATHNSAIGRQMSEGNFACLGEDGIFEGLRIVRGWPGTFTALVKSITSVRVAHGGGWRSCLGALTRNVDPKAARTPFRNLLRDVTPEVLRQLHVPVKWTSGSSVLATPRHGAWTTSEVVEHAGIDRRTLKNLVGNSECFLAKHPGASGAGLFDSKKISECVDLLRRSSRLSTFVKEVGLPMHCAEALIDAGVVNLLDHRDAQVLARGDPLLAADCVERLIPFHGPLEKGGCSPSASSLASLLRRELNPAVWIAALRGLQTGKFKAWKQPLAGNLMEAAFVRDNEFYGVVASARQEPVPDIRLSARAARPLLGVSDGFLWAAARAGLISFDERGLSLPSLEVFQKTFVLPSEIATWPTTNSQEFRKAAKAQRIRPIMSILRTRIWSRTDLCEFLPESPRAELLKA